MRLYQIWVHDTYLAGHIECEDHESVTDDDAIDYARRVWDSNISESDVWLCEITPSYYREIADSIPDDTVRYG